MAEQDDNWFGSFLSAAKDKGSKVFEFVKKDLEEFGNTVKNEASHVVSSTGNVLEKTLSLDSPNSTASSMKRSFSSFLGQMNMVLNPTPDDSDTEAILIVEDSEAVTLTKLQKAIYDLQKNDDTFLNDPHKDLEQKFEAWLEIIDDQLTQERLEKHLQSSTVLRKQYEKLVPDTVPHMTFWKRYLFKKALLEDEIAYQETLEKKNEKQKAISEETVMWDQESFAPYIELTEEEQIKLLQEYENEIKSTKTKINDDLSPSKEKNIVVTEECDKKEQIENITAEEVNSLKKEMQQCNIKENHSAISLDSSSSSTDGDWEKVDGFLTKTTIVTQHI